MPLVTDNKHAMIKTESGQTVDCKNAIKATCVPLQKLNVIAEMECMRTYCVASKGTVEDCLLYDSTVAYKYIRFKHCDEEHDYIVVGGCDYKIGQENSTGRFAEMNQYKRFLQSDIADIEDLAKRKGGVMNISKTGKPTAIYKDDDGKTHSFSALCPHMKGVVCWALTDQSWDCPVHGSRFSKDGMYVIGPAKGNLQLMNESGKQTQEQTAAAWVVVGVFVTLFRTKKSAYASYMVHFSKMRIEEIHSGCLCWLAE